MTQKQLDAAQWHYDNMEPYNIDYDDSECDVCVYRPFGYCMAEGETNETGDCPSFKDE